MIFERPSWLPRRSKLKRRELTQSPSESAQGEENLPLYPSGTGNPMSGMNTPGSPI